jgi:hypothetical protein
VRDFLALLRAFVRTQGVVGDTAGKEEKNPSGQKVKAGCLSSYAWSVLAMHVLLRFQFIPNIHTQQKEGGEGSSECSFSKENVPENIMHTEPLPMDSSRNVLFNRIMKSYKGEAAEEEAEKAVEPMTYAKKLCTVSTLELLHLLFGYVSGSVDVFGSVVTMRGEGEVRYDIR